MNERLQRAPVGVLEVAADGTVTGVNDVARELLDAGDAAEGCEVEAVAPRSVEDSLRDAFEGASVTDADFEEYYPDLDRWLAVSIVPAEDATAVYLRDVTTPHRRAETVERLRAERDRTAVIDEVLSEVLADLVGSSSRGEVAETICSGLGETDLYEFAWVGERNLGGDRLAVRASAGAVGETFRAVRDALDGPATTPEERAVDTGRLQAVQPLAEETAVPEAVRMAGFADGVQSVLAMPLVYDGNVYGVVGVYASGTGAFSPRERRSFETLGEIAGFAVTAARNRNLLLSDAVTEVTFDVGAGSALATLGGALDAAVTLDGVVPQDDALLCFLEVECGDPTAIDAAVADTGGVRDARIVSETPSGATVEVELHGPSPLLAVSSLGGTVRRASVDGGSARLVADLPRESDVRRITDVLTTDFDAEVVAKRERERSVTTARDLRDELADRLTDRQETVLRTAYLADYFESPRGSTAEEVASALDITGSTLLHHLRAGQRTVFDALFGEAAE